MRTSSVAPLKQYDIKFSATGMHHVISLSITFNVAWTQREPHPYNTTRSMWAACTATHTQTNEHQRRLAVRRAYLRVIQGTLRSCGYLLLYFHASDGFCHSVKRFALRMNGAHQTFFHLV